MEEQSHRKRSRDDDDSYEFESTNAKRIREQILSLLDDSDTVPDHDMSHELESLIRSFEEEISGSKSSSSVPDPVTHLDLETGTGELLPEVGEVNRVGTELQGICELWDFQDDLMSYDPFIFGFGYNTGEFGNRENGKEYVPLDGIFDYSDDNFGSNFLVL